MDIYRFKSYADEDGLLNLRVPLNAGTGEVEVVVIVHPVEPPKGQKPKQRGAVPDYVAKARETSPRAFEPWTEEEERQLMEMYHAEMDIQVIAQTLGRRPRAIEARVLKVLSRDKEQG